MRASESSSSSLSRSRHLRTLLEKLRMVHLLKTTRPKLSPWRRKSKSYYSPFVRLSRGTCLRRPQLATIVPNHFESLFTAEASLCFRRELGVEVRTPNANLLEFFILKRKGGKSVKGPRITSRQQESLKKVRNFRACTLVPLIPSKDLKDNKGSHQAKNHNHWYESQDELQVSYAQGGNC